MFTMLTFATPEDRLQAEQLMQPTLIRVIDNLRKQIETTSWQSKYVERVLWPASATEADQQKVKEIAASLETATPDQEQQLRQQLNTLPTPLPTYQLHLTQDGNTVVLDVWQLCFQVCFVNYEPGVPVRVDRGLLDTDHEIDWMALDEKAQNHVSVAIQQVSQSKQG
jgi:hypothetical protein